MGQPAGQPFVFLKFDFRRRRPNPTRSQMETPELIVNRCVFLQILWKYTKKCFFYKFYENIQKNGFGYMVCYYISK